MRVECRLSAELSFVLSQFTRVTNRRTGRRTDRQTDRQTAWRSERPRCIQCSAVKTALKVIIVKAKCHKNSVTSWVTVSVTVVSLCRWLTSSPFNRKWTCPSPWTAISWTKSPTALSDCFSDCFLFFQISICSAPVFVSFLSELLVSRHSVRILRSIHFWFQCYKSATIVHETPEL